MCLSFNLMNVLSWYSMERFLGFITSIILVLATVSFLSSYSRTRLRLIYSFSFLFPLPVTLICIKPFLSPSFRIISDHHTIYLSTSRLPKAFAPSPLGEYFRALSASLPKILADIV
jgi:hypothetical protein